MKDVRLTGPRVTDQRVQTEDQKPTIEQAALRGAKALVDMPAADRDQVIGQLPGLVKDIAQTVVGGPLDNLLLKRPKQKLVALIQQGANQVANETSAAGSRVGDLRAALTAEGGVVPQTAKALAEIASKAGVTPEDFDRLVGKLELLAQLHGNKDFGMISNRKLKAKIAELTNGNLAELATAVGQELAQLAYGPVRRAAMSGQIV